MCREAIKCALLLNARTDILFPPASAGVSRSRGKERVIGWMIVARARQPSRISGN
jgi:hypothetical protein